MRYRKRRRKRAMLCDIPLTPLIDTALTLLIIFMLASPMMHNAIHVNLPATKTSDESLQHQKPVVVYINREGAVYFNEQLVAVHDLCACLTPEVVTRSEGTVFVKADQEICYKNVIQVVDVIKSVPGIKSVGLSTKQA